MWTLSSDGIGLRAGKHVYAGTTRVATRLRKKDSAERGGTYGSLDYVRVNTYYYHSDHLGSAQLVTDYEGNEYEHIEYTPYGELFLERIKDGVEKLPFRFTGKELDPETGLYYYGARYLDPKTSLWLSSDPALKDYIPLAPTNDEAKKHNQNLPGMGGVFNLVNLHLYHYAGNNPIRYVDPTGEDFCFYVDPNGAGGNGHTILYLQNKNGDWYKFEQGAAGEPSSGNLGFVSGSSVPAGVSIEHVDGPPKGASIIKTTKEQDAKIYLSALLVQKEHELGLKKYNLWTNNCTDAAVSVINESGTGIKVPGHTLFTVRPNDWFGVYLDWAKNEADQRMKEGSEFPLDMKYLRILIEEMKRSKEI